MEAFVYQAALWCEDCGSAIRKRLNLPRDDFRRDDSNAFPVGPYTDGGGEADSPQHCDGCGVFLENPLTGDGVAYVRDLIREHEEKGRGNAEVIAEWRGFYADVLEDDSE